MAQPGGTEHGPAFRAGRFTGWHSLADQGKTEQKGDKNGKNSQA